MKGAEGKTIEIKTPNRTLTFTGLSYLTGLRAADFYFHESMTYALLRSGAWTSQDGFPRIDIARGSSQELDHHFRFPE